MALSGPHQAAKSGKADSLVVLVHGYGADGNDMIGLATPLAQLLPGTAFAAPDGPEPCPGASRQWFAIADLDPKVMHQGVVAATPALKEFIEAELRRLDLPPSRLALVGFSQGTMMALHLGLAALKPAAIIGFSGVMTGEVPPAAAFPPVFLSHGSADPVIPPEALFATATILGTAGVRVRWHLSPGVGHGIDDGALSLGANFLKLAFGGRLAAEGPCCSLLQ